MSRDLGCWLIRPTGEIVQMLEDPKSEYYFEPRELPEKRPGERTEMINASDAYRRYTLRDGPLSAGIFYARADPGPEDRARLLETMYSNYGRD